MFNTYIYEPILWLLRFIYENVAFHDLGIAIIVLTLLIRVVLYPLFYKGARDQAIMQELQPKIKKLQEELKNDKEAQVKAMMQLYRDNKLNPLSGFLVLLIQIPIIIALYRVFLGGVTTELFPEQSLLGFMDLHEKNVLLAVLAAGLQYVQTKLSLVTGKIVSSDNPVQSAMKSMTYFGPIISFVVLMNLPAAVGLYWLTSTVASVLQQLVVNKKILNKTSGSVQ